MIVSQSDNVDICTNTLQGGEGGEEEEGGERK